jgi:hypothetical protein
MCICMYVSVGVFDVRQRLAPAGISISFLGAGILSSGIHHDCSSQASPVSDICNFCCN